jgi:hypothetical protein
VALLAPLLEPRRCRAAVQLAAASTGTLPADAPAHARAGVLAVLLSVTTTLFPLTNRL